MTREERMHRFTAHKRRLEFEVCEHRTLLSAITDLMSANSIAAHQRALTAVSSPGSVADAGVTRFLGHFVPSTQSIAVAENQGPPPIGTNLALTPTGTLSRREIRKERFVAQFKGTYTIGPGRTSTEAKQTFITAAGSANTMRHSDIQVLIVTPNDRNSQIGGVCVIFDRNINSNTSLGLDLLAPQQNVDAGGRPKRFTSVTLDVNMSAGTYVSGFAQGVVNIRYTPSGKRTPGVSDQGKAIITIHAQIYAPDVAFILRNANINP
jgi:hypothetical protein